MALQDELFSLCNKLTQHGWRDLLFAVTKNQLDINQPDATKLSKHLQSPIANINRNVVGFEDFSLEGAQGITGFSFAKSLLYHALASPAVVANSISYYPSLADLDLVENFIFSTNIETRNSPQTLEGLKNKHGNRMVIAVFAYQYRTWQGSSHRAHADMNFSRTGIARVGTGPETYDAERRSFWVGDRDGIVSVLPSRYGTFLAIEDNGLNLSSQFTIMDKTDQDNTSRFLVPVHKLFGGSECLSDIILPNLQYETYQRNEKLKKIHDLSLRGTIKIDPKYKLKEFPFVIDDLTHSGFLYTTERLSGSILIKPVPDKIVQPAIQNNEYVVFTVPAADNANRFNTSFQIPASPGGRKSSEYVNIRHTVANSTVNSTDTDIVSINDLPLDQFNTRLQNGNYLAVDFIDKSADGFVKAKITLPQLTELRSFAAYSVITALDFFPLVNQRDIYRWDNSDLIQQFRQGGVSPLSNGRIKANINYTNFGTDSETVTAVLSMREARTSSNEKERIDDSSLSYLPDGASDVFAPGWDISMDTKEGVSFHASYGLGSPFPEDAKLCAALNSFWPAAAPDASRTFFTSATFTGFERQPTAIPLTDQELGVYPKHAIETGSISKVGWDGEFGPFLQKEGTKEFVNYADMARSDYTFNAWKGLMNMDFLKRVKTTQFIARMKALQECLTTLPPTVDSVINNKLWLVSFREIMDWANEPARFNNQLTGSGLCFIFITTTQAVPQVDSNDIKRLRVLVDNKFECQFNENMILWKNTSLPASPLNSVNRNMQAPRMNLISRIL